MRRRRRENIPAVKCRARGFQLIGGVAQLDDVIGLGSSDGQTEHAVVRADEVIGGRFNQDGAARAAHTGIDDDHVDSPARKVRHRVAQGQSPRHDVLRRNAVREIDDLHARIDACDDAFHDSYERIAIAEVCGQGNQHQICRAQQDSI